MSNSTKTILVTGATGQQGGATARHLLAEGWRVRGLTRDAGSDKARALAATGVDVVEGDLYDRASIDAALQGVYGVFSVQNFWLPDVGAEGEMRQGKLLANAAQAAGVQHFVYTSVGGAEKNSGVPHFESKWQIEQHIRALGLPHTIWRPVSFMDNYNWSRPLLLNGTYPSIGLEPGRTQQLIAADDIGIMAALSFAQRERFLGQAIELASDELTEPQIAAVFTRVIGRPVEVGPGVSRRGGDETELKRMRNWFNDVGYQADIPSLRQIYPALMTLEQYLRRSGWENAEPVAMSAAAWGS